jgi:ribosome biogenesis GTPase
MIGQSGVGKSTLINALLNDSVQEVSALSEKSGHGRHTTTTSVLYRLPTGGELIDSPGVRDDAPYIDDPRDVQHGFREIARFSGSCRFDDCAHLAEPDCAVKEAVTSGAITSRRYESYKALLDLTESLQARHR